MAGVRHLRVSDCLCTEEAREVGGERRGGEGAVVGVVEVGARGGGEPSTLPPVVATTSLVFLYTQQSSNTSKSDSMNAPPRCFSWMGVLGKRGQERRGEERGCRPPHSRPRARRQGPRRRLGR